MEGKWDVDIIILACFPPFWPQTTFIPEKGNSMDREENLKSGHERFCVVLETAARGSKLLVTQCRCMVIGD